MTGWCWHVDGGFSDGLEGVGAVVLVVLSVRLRVEGY